MPVNGRQNKPSSRSAARAASTNPQLRKLQGLHEVFAQGLETALSALLQKEIRVRLGAIGLVGVGEFQKTLVSPDCIIALRLHPRPDQMVLQITSATALTLLELLLGGTEGPPPAPRALTEIEWGLLEEIVRVILRPLAEAWRGIAEIEFEVDSLGNDPALVKLPPNAGPLVRVPVGLEWDDRTGTIAVAMPQEFFGGASGQTETSPASAQDADRNLRLLEDAAVEIEVVLRGPTLPFEQLIALTPGQVVTFNYPVSQPLEASLNGEVWMAGHVVGAGRKRAFQVAQLPQ